MERPFTFINRLAAILVLAAAGCGGGPDASPMHPLAAENRLLTLETRLAKKNDLYSVFNLPARTIQIKIRGIVLREFAVHSVVLHHLWVPRVDLHAVDELGVSPYPERVVMSPQKKDKTAADSETVVVESLEDSFEVSDMPEFYSIEMKDGSMIFVLPGAARGPDISGRSIGMVARSAFFAKRLMSFRRPSATIVMDPDSCRALYWALLNPIPILLSA